GMERAENFAAKFRSHRPRFRLKSSRATGQDTDRAPHVWLAEHVLAAARAFRGWLWGFVVPPVESFAHCGVCSRNAVSPAFLEGRDHDEAVGYNARCDGAVGGFVGICTSVFLSCGPFGASGNSPERVAGYWSRRCDVERCAESDHS